MAQTIKLKRSALEGRIPQLADLSLGEIAINTFDGRAFLRRSGSSPTPDQVLPFFMIGAQNSGSAFFTGSFNIEITGSVSGSPSPFQINSGSDSFLFVSSSGKVGVGTSAPVDAALLHVFGIISSSNILTNQGGALWTASADAGAFISREGDVQISGNLDVDGTLTAQVIRTEFTTSTVLFESGSTRFGDSLDDIHQFTGSVNVTNSLDVDGNVQITGSQDFGTVALGITGALDVLGKTTLGTDPAATNAFFAQGEAIFTGSLRGCAENVELLVATSAVRITGTETMLRLVNSSNRTTFHKSCRITLEKTDTLLP